MPTALKNLKSGVADVTDILPKVVAAGADGAVTIQNSVVVLTKAGVAAMTLAAPSTAQNGTRITFIAATANAHTVTATTIGFNAGDTDKDVATFGAAVGNNFEVIAYGGEWLVVGTPVGVTFA